MGRSGVFCPESLESWTDFVTWKAKDTLFLPVNKADATFPEKLAKGIRFRRFFRVSRIRISVLLSILLVQFVSARLGHPSPRSRRMHVAKSARFVPT